MATFEELAAQSQEIRQAIEAGTLDSLDAIQLAKYVRWLTQPAIGGHFAGNEYPQVCETVRLHMLRALIDGFEKRGKAMQYWVIALAVAALLTSVVQTWVALRPESRTSAPTARASEPPTVPAAAASGTPKSNGPVR